MTEEVEVAIAYQVTEPPLIPFGHHFTEDELDGMRTVAAAKRPNMFAKPKSEYQRFTADLRCNECGGSTMATGLTKTRLLKAIAKPDSWTCDPCRARLAKEKADQIEEKKREQQKLYESSTHDYIDLYLDPGRSWNKDFSQGSRWNAITRPWVDWDVIGKYIRDQLGYYEFLGTPYWAAVSARAKYKAKFRCQLCNQKGSLQTHHRTYGHHGTEHLHMEDLIVLCSSCHKSFHENLSLSKVRD